AEITVTDSGQGISPEFLPYVFDRFRQADSTTTRRHGGLGLGLAIVRHLVELHGGSVQAHSDGEGCGPKFTLRFPLIAINGGEEMVARRSAKEEAESVPGMPRNSTDDAQPLNGLRVLIVDDEPDAREILTTMFRQCGAQVNAAASTGEALDVLS